jgi:hypothetical protein
MKNSDYAQKVNSGIIKNEGGRFIVTLLTIGAVLICIEFRDAVISITKSSFDNYIAALLPPVLLAFAMYGIYLTRAKPSLKSFVVVSAASSFLVCILRVLMISGKAILPEPVTMAVVVHAAAFGITLLIRFLFIKYITKKDCD